MAHPMTTFLEWVAESIGGVDPKDIDEVHWRKRGGDDNRSKLDVRMSPRAQDIQIQIVSEINA